MMLLFLREKLLGVDVSSRAYTNAPNRFNLQEGIPRRQEGTLKNM